MSDKPRRRQWRRVDGILLVDKPSGPGSNAVLQHVRNLFRAAKAGHAGTLDPLASGLLPVCFGEATKFAQSLLDARKRYRATIRFGARTTTGDAEGDIIATAEVTFDADALRTALRSFIGTIAQTPPAYSALKRDGRPYYSYARAGDAVERVPREVHIQSFELIDWAPPDAIVDVECSKGTYVRVLAEDIAVALSSAAHLAGLRRTASGPMTVDAAITVETLEALDDAARDAVLLPVDAALSQMPAINVDAEIEAGLRHGRRPLCVADVGRHRIYGPSGFIGVADANGATLAAVRLMALADATVTR
ncbi:MAG TPA: tRNA pseudouridine(55) synthase TruB [Casimicrobiaceae bacterium]|nr:tRNA pseudouridine(55) synthase TruB [Casimicrobiaceae bacterium]